MSNHLSENNMSYIQHMKCALGYAKESGKAMVYFFVHAFLPNTLIKNGSSKINHIASLLNERNKK